jgi:hypothetical protein
VGGVLLSDQEALQIIAVLADVHDGHQIDRTRAASTGHSVRVDALGARS